MINTIKSNSFYLLTPLIDTGKKNFFQGTFNFRALQKSKKLNEIHSKKISPETHKKKKRFDKNVICQNPIPMQEPKE